MSGGDLFERKRNNVLLGSYRPRPALCPRESAEAPPALSKCGKRSHLRSRGATAFKTMVYKGTDHLNFLNHISITPALAQGFKNTRSTARQREPGMSRAQSLQACPAWKCLIFTEA